jgi:hypothetical protein
MVLYKLVKLLKNVMETLLARISRVLAYYGNERQSLLVQVADLRGQLAIALANDKSDQETIAQAQAEAAAAKATAADAVAAQEKLQAIVDANATTEAAIDSLLTPIEANIPTDAPAA